MAPRPNRTVAAGRIYGAGPFEIATGVVGEGVGTGRERGGSWTRRDFVKYTSGAGIAGALAGMGVLSALGIVKGPQEPVPPWEVAPGVVDYSLVPSLRDLDRSQTYVLRTANWYDYWPGSFLLDFEAYMLGTYGLHVKAAGEWDSYTSNEELFNWITLGKRRYDVIFPSNYLVDLLKKADMIYTLNLDWLPNFQANIDSELISRPADNPYDRRGPNGPFVSVPYFWGTTGIGFRTDRFSQDKTAARAEVKEIGYDFFWMDSYQPQDPTMPPISLDKRMRMLDDERDVIGAGLKKAGWEWQKTQGLSPTGRFPPDGPQWTTNETDPARIDAAREWLFAAKPRLFDYNSTDQGTSLISGSSVINQAWSGDMMYAIRPDQNVPQPIEYIIPPQGSTWWLDCAAIHNRSRNLAIAHAFIDFIHQVDGVTGGMNVRLTKWNMYSTPNLAAYEYLQTHPFPNGYNMTTDPRLYPNKNAPEDFAICDLSQDVGFDTMENVYNPLWFDLTTD